MSMQAAQIAVRSSRHHIVVQAIGRTPRGQSYIKDSRTLKVTSVRDPKFKAEMAAAVEEMIGSGA